MLINSNVPMTCSYLQVHMYLHKIYIMYIHTHSYIHICMEKTSLNTVKYLITIYYTDSTSFRVVLVCYIYIYIHMYVCLFLRSILFICIQRISTIKGDCTCSNTFIYSLKHDYKHSSVFQYNTYIHAFGYGNTYQHVQNLNIIICFMI